MTDHPTATWTGASGTKYTYYVWPRHPDIKAGQVGNYIYAKSVGGRYQAVYIGQGDLSVRATSDHHRTDCIDTKGATSVHVHINTVEKDRLAEERDLRATNENAYTPTGCNVKRGG
jgi:hypothetical protein